MHHRFTFSLHYLIWWFLFLICISTIYLETHAEDLLEKAFYQAKVNETVINLWDTTNAVGNEILREWVGIQDSFGQWCFVDWQKISGNEVKNMVCTSIYQGSFASFDANIQEWEVYIDECTLPNWSTRVISNEEKKDFCQTVLWWDWDVPALTTQAPLIVRIAKWLLRITIVLSITMVIYNGVLYIVESAKWGEVKNATKNIWLIVAGILIALLSLGIINLISSITISTLQ